MPLRSTETSQAAKPSEVPRVLGLAEGGHQAALSGVPHYLFKALDRHLPMAGRLDYAPHGVRRLALAAATFRPTRSSWRARFHTSLIAHRALSATLATRLAEANQSFDLAIQVFGWVARQPHPFVLYLDQTRLMAERGWPAWMPFTPGERSELLILERNMYEDAAHVFVMGRAARDSLVADYGLPRTRITVVGGGVNFEFLPEPAGPAQQPNVLFVGREFERKGGDVLIEAFRRVRLTLPSARLHMVGGTGDLKEPGVTDHGKLFDRRQLSRLYGGARLFCLPSRYEPWGLVLVEAMAHGLPCVGSTTQSIPHILGNGNAGLLTEPGDVDELAAALLRLLTDDDLARRIGAAGRLRAESEFTWDRVAERMLPVLSAIHLKAPAG